MKSQPKNLEFRINPENFHPCALLIKGHLKKFPMKGPLKKFSILIGDSLKG